MPARTIKPEQVPPTSTLDEAGGTSSQQIVRTLSVSRAETGRFSRSGAPSVDTRLSRNRIHSSGHTNGEDDDEPVLMEVRQVKPEPDHNGMDPRIQLAATGNTSFVHSFTAIGDKVKEFNDTLGELQSLGIQHVTSLPELVLVGDQSAGKSSLMSSFSGIYLPRSEGACTRCPVHIRLSGSQSGPWSCRISLQQDYEYRPPAPVTRANPFGPWFEQHRDVKEFATLNDQSSIEETLRWAQIATLNPSRDHSLYKPGSGELWRRGRHLATDEVSNEAAFSPNMVAVDISAPGSADLSFYDLPGVFNSAKRDEDQYLVQVVSNLTAKYIAHQQAIILWAVPMNADPETSMTYSLIRTQRAQARTIGIMTKADLLPPDPNAPLQWMAMLRGEQHHVGHGYFITARPAVTDNLMPDDLVTQRSSNGDGDNNSSNNSNTNTNNNGSGSAGAAADLSRPLDGLERQSAYEEAFFNKQLPGLGSQEWRNCFRDFEDRCGVNRLVAFMSQQLGTEFAKSLPQIKEKVTLRLLEVNEELAKLPEMPENPELEVRRSLAEFASQARTVLEGDALSQPWRDIVHGFRNAILELKPRYIVKVGASGSTSLPPRVDANGRIDLTRDDESVASSSHFAPATTTPTATPHVNGGGGGTGHRRRFDDFLDGQNEANIGVPVTPTKRPRGGADTSDTNGNSNGIKAETQSEYGFGTPRTQRIEQLMRPRSRTLLDVRAVIHARSRTGMPTIVKDDVYNSLCMEAVAPWNAAVEQLVDNTHHLLETSLRRVLYGSLRNLRERKVFAEAVGVLQRFLASQLATLRERLLRQHRLETRRFYTLDQESLVRHEAEEAKILGRHRHHFRMVAYMTDRGKEQPPLRNWDAMADEDRIREEARTLQEAAKLGADPFARELGVCAYVRGYYLVASTRFIDTSVMQVVSGLVPDVAETLSKLYLDGELGLLTGTTPQTFVDLMAEDPATFEKRARLKEDGRRFEQTMRSIERLESASQSSTQRLDNEDPLGRPTHLVEDNAV